MVVAVDITLVLVDVNVVMLTNLLKCAVFGSANERLHAHHGQVPFVLFSEKFVVLRPLVT
jgi:hypothetical protein